MKGSELVFEAATAFWRSGALFAGCELGVFDALAEKGMTAGDTAGALGLSDRGTRALLEALVGMGLLSESAGVYRATEAAAHYLARDSEASLSVTLGLQAATYPLWHGLADAVREGRPAMPPGRMLGGDPALTRQFVVGMHQRALGVARGMVDALDLSGRQRLADIGGGPGTYAVLLCRRYPELKATVMDLAPVLAVARELIDATEEAGRIETVPCDATRDDFGSGYDAALVSGLLHRLNGGQARDLLGRAGAALRPGGLLVVNDLLAEGHAPAMAVLFGLQMLLTSEQGRTHGVDEVQRWLADAGFVQVAARTLPPPLPHTLVSGVKAAAP